MAVLSASDNGFLNRSAQNHYLHIARSIYESTVLFFVKFALKRIKIIICPKIKMGEL